MKLKKLHIALVASAITLGNAASAQLYIDNATFLIQSGATVTVQGDVTSNTDIQGAGKVLLKGSANQNVNMGGFSIPNLEVDNVANVTLTANAKIGNSVLFTNGKISLGNNTATLSSTATATGMGTGKFFETNGTGFLRKEVTGDIVAYNMPVGTGSDYTPVAISNTGSTYNAASIGVQAKGLAEPNRHPRTESYLTVYWPISKSGITGGSTTGTGTYVDSRVTGTENDLRGLFWTGSQWSLAGGNQNTTANTATATLLNNAGSLYAMNRFVLSKLKVFLQGPYNTVSGIMNDNLRTAPSLIPTSDPYRTAPYSSFFTHVNNTTVETVNPLVFGNAANADDDIVDWVFVELRQNTSPGNTILQTRSALLQQDGDIVDIDGTSPLYFKNLDSNSNYSVGIRHRNHLGIYTNTNNAGNLLTFKLSTPSTIDFSTLSAGQLFGTATTNYAVVGGKNLMYAGNVNQNANIRWNAPSSDKDFILSNVLGGISTNVLSNVYSVGDVNLNRSVRWNAPNSDRDFILSTPLSTVSTNVRSQVAPN